MQNFWISLSTISVHLYKRRERPITVERLYPAARLWLVALLPHDFKFYLAIAIILHNKPCLMLLLRGRHGRRWCVVHTTLVYAVFRFAVLTCKKLNNSASYICGHVTFQETLASLYFVTHSIYSYLTHLQCFFNLILSTTWRLSTTMSVTDPQASRSSWAPFLWLGWCPVARAWSPPHPAGYNAVDPSSGCVELQWTRELYYNCVKIPILKLVTNTIAWSLFIFDFLHCCNNLSG